MTQDDIILHLTKTQPTPSLDDVMTLVTDLDDDYTSLIGTLTALKVIKKPHDFTSRLRSLQRRATIQSELGAIPTTTRDLVEAVLVSTGYTINATSSTPLMWQCPFSNQRAPLDLKHLLQVVQERNRNLLGGQFKDTDIRHECEYFQTQTDEALRLEVAKKVTQPNTTFDWSLMAQTCFDLSEVREALVIAALQKLVWQVKRKLHRLPVTHHLMPVIYGTQGCGKTVFVTKMLDVLGSLWGTADFGRLTDNREAGLFENYVLFLDEMHKADRAEMEGVKGAITREFYSFRPMGTNMEIKRPQKSSFIGCSNKLLGQLINDPTGNRRFFQLDFKSDSGDAEHAFVNALDFTAMWCSVDHQAEDPSAPYFEEMAELRKQSVNATSVGMFVRQLEENKGEYQVKDYAGVSLKSIGDELLCKEDLFFAYREFCEAMRVSRPYEQQAFHTELLRMLKQNPKLCFQKKKGPKFNGWAYTGDIQNSAAFARAERKREMRESLSRFNAEARP